jgi:D-sedoheptulose 7-phosphate isomerase
MPDSPTRIRAYLREAHQVLTRFLGDDKNIEAIRHAAGLMTACLLRGGKILSCGNGGSLCDAMHFAEELTGRYREDRRPLPAIAIADSSHISCTANDYGYQYVFSRYVEALGREGDVLLAISTSGNSENVLLAAEAARKIGMKVVGLTGKDGGKLATLCDAEIRAPHSGYADHIQEIHIKAIHCLIKEIEYQLNP